MITFKINQSKATMENDLINQALKIYFHKKGNNIKVIQRFLRIKYNLAMDEKVLQRRLKNLSLN